MHTPPLRVRTARLLPVLLLASFCAGMHARAVVNVFFDASQSTNLVAAGTTSDTIGTEGYLFECTRDKLFTGGVGLTEPIGRNLRIHWPDGLEAQAVTTGPATGKAQILLTRQDGEPFAIRNFTAKLLGNTAGAGGSIEVMPLLNGEDGAPDPYAYGASGFYGQNFTYNTPELAGFDAYKINIYVDFAIMDMTVEDASIPPPVVDVVDLGANTFLFSWPAAATGFTLESATNLPAAVWNPVATPPDLIGDVFQLQMESAGPREYFRLRK